MIEPHDQHHCEDKDSESQRADGQPYPGLGAAIAELVSASDREDDREESAKRPEREHDARRKDE